MIIIWCLAVFLTLWIIGGTLLFTGYVHGVVDNTNRRKYTFDNIDFAPHRKLKHALFAVACGPLAWIVLFGALSALGILEVAKCANQYIQRPTEKTPITVRIIRWFLEDAYSGIHEL